MKEEKLKYLPDRPLLDAEGGQFFYQAYVTSPYLDARVNDQRTTFDIQEDSAKVR